MTNDMIEALQQDAALAKSKASLYSMLSLAIFTATALGLGWSIWAWVRW